MLPSVWFQNNIVPPESKFFNYKDTFSLVLLAVVDAEYCFCIIDAGSYGRISDGGILANSAFGRALRSGTLQLPPDLPLPGADHRGPQPHVFVTDEKEPDEALPWPQPSTSPVDLQLPAVSSSTGG